jgi:hypothetical protein
MYNPAFCCMNFRCIHKIVKSDLALLCLSVHPSVCPNGTPQFPLDRLSSNFIFEDFLKILWENSSLIKI